MCVLAVTVWLEFALFMTGDKRQDAIRDVFERAVDAVGLHVPSGALVWQGYREYELVVLEAIKVSYWTRCTMT